MTGIRKGILEAAFSSLKLLLFVIGVPVVLYVNPRLGIVAAAFALLAYYALAIVVIGFVQAKYPALRSR